MRLWIKPAPTEPGVYRRAWLRGPSVIPHDELDSATAALNDLLRGRTEILFHKLYDVVALRLAAVLRALTEPDLDDLRLLKRLAESVGRRLTAEDTAVNDPEIDQIVWRDAARASTLTLFDFLAAELAEGRERLDGRDPHLAVSAADWANRTAKHPRFDREYFTRISGLVAEEIDLGLQIAAQEATEWQVLAAPGTQLLYGKQRMVVIAQPEIGLLECVGTDAPTVAFLETTSAARFVDDYLVVPAADSVVQAISMPLFWQPEEHGILVAASDGSRVVPDQWSLKLRFDGARVRSADESLAFEAEHSGGSIAIAAADVQSLGGDQFLLKAQVEHTLR